MPGLIQNPFTMSTYICAYAYRFFWPLTRLQILYSFIIALCFIRAGKNHDLKKNKIKKIGFFLFKSDFFLFIRFIVYINYFLVVRK